MPQIAPVVVNNGTADLTFSPRGQDGAGVTTFAHSSGVPIADKRITIQRSRTANSGREKVTLKATVPVVVEALENGVAGLAPVRTAYCDVSFTFDKSSTEAERTALRSMVADLLGAPVVGALVDDLEYLY